jgi:predicted pyridoxine 5'-phosphate oxidase superfamily flavin-nucleotide-binding protein
VLDETTLVIPDRPGNRRADTFTNLLANDRIALIFLIPGKQETLRVSGRAVIVRDLAVREPLAVAAKVPDFAIVVAVEQVFFHCAKCIIRSGLWTPGSWPAVAGLASLAETLVAAAKPEESVEQLQRQIDDDAATHLY